ncbi:MAG: GAF domain-containing protein, partial [Dehalococcoidia bacterium]
FYSYGLPLSGMDADGIPPVTGQLTQIVFEQGKPVIIDITARDQLEDVARLADANAQSGFKSWLIAPLIRNNQLFAMLHFKSTEENAYDDSHLETARQIAAQISGHVASNVAYQKLNKEATTNDTLARIGKVVVSSNNFSEILPEVDKLTSEILTFDGISVMAFDPTTELFKLMLNRGVMVNADDEYEAITLPYEEFEFNKTIANKVIATGEVDLLSVESIDQLQGYPRSIDAYNSGVRTFLTAPLISNGNITGAIQIRGNSRNAFDDADVDIIKRIADQLAGALANSIANDKLSRESEIRNVLALISQVASSSTDMAVMFPKIEELAATIIDFDGFSVGYYDDESKIIRRLYAREVTRGSNSNSESLITASEFQADDSVISTALDERKTLILNVSSLEEIQHFKESTNAYEAGARTFLTAPLFSNDRAVAVLQLRSKLSNAYSDAHINIIERIADQIVGPLVSSQVNEQIKVQAAALRAADNPMVIATPAGIVEWVNPAFTASTGWSYDEIVGQHTSLMRSDDPADKPVNDEIWEFLSRGESWSGVHLNRNKDGSENHEEVTVTPVLDKNGDVTHLIALKQDITNRLIAEHEHDKSLKIESENRELQRVADARSEFLSTVSHELRTPLTTVSAFADILLNSRSDNLTVRQKTHVGLIRKSSAQLASLIDDLLDISQADTGRIILDKEAFVISTMINEVSDTSAVLFTSRDQKLEVTNVSESRALHADRSRVLQIISNLLTNASKFSEVQTKIELVVELENQQVAFTVIDRGRGISQADQAMMFSPFFRGSNEGLMRPEGVGLGLAVVRSLVDLHDGVITVESTQGAGTSITVSLPGVIPN